MVLLVARKKMECYNVGKGTKSQNQKQVCESRESQPEHKSLRQASHWAEFSETASLPCLAFADYCLCDNEVPKDETWGAHEVPEVC